MLASVLALGGCLTPEASEPVERPNILLIIADDLGWSDLGAYGSEIPTPNLDALAESGMRAQRFYVASRGSPTRAMLLTGVDHHVAGFHSRHDRIDSAEEDKPDYLGTLSPDVVTVASLLRADGYHTSMAGKWELGTQPENLPSERGFERSFALLDGAASHWSDMRSAIPGRELATFTKNDVVLESLPDDFFSTKTYTDFVIESVEQAAAEGRPFFAFLSFQAPHGPLADDGMNGADGLYAEGYDAVRDERLLRMKYMGLIDHEVKPYPGIPTVPPWSALDDAEKATQVRKMELYAGMVAGIDRNVGRLLARLRELGTFDDTLVVFLSDNGPEPGDRGALGMDRRDREWYVAQFPETGFEEMGGPGSFVEYGAAWAQVSSVPFRLFKGTQAEGGIRSPLIMSGPGVAGRDRLGRHRVSRAMIHVKDLAPTFLELADVAHPETWEGRPVSPMHGTSLVPHLQGHWRERKGPHRWLGFAYTDGRALSRGRHKIVWMPPPFGVGTWRLYRIDYDPAERWDRAKRDPEKLAELVALWEEYAARYGVAGPGVASDAADPAQKPSESVMK